METLPKPLRTRVESAIAKYPEIQPLVKDLIAHYENSGPSHKKQKTQQVGDKTALPSSLAGAQIVLQIPDLSVQSPLRKRLNLVIGAFPGEAPFFALTKQIETRPEFVLNDLSGNNVDFATFLHVPDKKDMIALLITYKHNMGDLYKQDPLLVQLNNTQLTEQFGPVLNDMSLVQFLMKQFESLGLPVVDGTADDVFFVQTYNGTKEGWLYFLHDHIIFGFRKPILVFDNQRVDSVTYTSITRITFNATLVVSEGETTEKYEFSMIDQKEFEKIDGYVKSQNFQDRSMAEELKAQKQLKSRNETSGALVDAAKLVPGGNEIVGDQDDDEDDDYELGAENDDEDEDSDDYDDDDDDDDLEDDDNDEDGDESEDDDLVEQSENGDESEENVDQELKDLQDGLDDGDYLQMGGFANTPR